MPCDPKASVRTDEEDIKILLLRKLIRTAFPAGRYEGTITPVDGVLSPELDEEQVLQDTLKGCDWTEIPDEFIALNPDGLALLTDEAFRSFLPAWLMHSLNAIEGQNETRELIIYMFGQTNGERSDSRLRTRLEALTIDQREAIRQAMLLFSVSERDPFIRSRAKNALRVLDSLWLPSSG